MARTTVRELSPAMGETVHVRLESFTVPCIVLDVKNAWGNVRLLVKPVLGLGEQWIELGRLVAAPPPAPARAARCTTCLGLPAEPNDTLCAACLRNWA
jgi:hypothetical protein